MPLSNNESPPLPPTIDPIETFDALVRWVREEIGIKRKAPGLIMGLSGTDSILAFLICSDAFNQIGKAHRVVGVHYGEDFPPIDKTPEQVEKILSLSPGYRWVSRIIMPWLRARSPDSQLIVDNSFDYTSDNLRWGHLRHRALNGASKREPLSAGEDYWIVGTRNATEQALGTYSNASEKVSLQPIIDLWKSDVLKLCTALGVPRIAIDNSRQVDCDCGRFDLAAAYIEEVDAILKARAGLISRSDLLKAMAPDLLGKLKTFIDEQTAYAGFKIEIPYSPTVRDSGGPVL
jgi:8-oxo-dGTP pyrophosphatase MutT (NUDIX family)